MPKTTLTMTTKIPAKGITITIPITVEGPKHGAASLAAHFDKAVAECPPRFKKPGGGIHVSFEGTDENGKSGTKHSIETDAGGYRQLRGYIFNCDGEALEALLATL